MRVRDILSEGKGAKDHIKVYYRDGRDLIVGGEGPLAGELLNYNGMHDIEEEDFLYYIRSSGVERWLLVSGDKLYTSDSDGDNKNLYVVSTNVQRWLSERFNKLDMYCLGFDIEGVEHLEIWWNYDKCECVVEGRHDVNGFVMEKELSLGDIGVWFNNAADCVADEEERKAMVDTFEKWLEKCRGYKFYLVNSSDEVVNVYLAVKGV